MLRGNEFFKKKQFEEAIEWYNKSIDLNSNYISAFYNKALALTRLKKNEEAIDFFDQVIKINPKYISALSSKGIALMHLNKNEDALVCMKKAIDLDPNLDSQSFLIDLYRYFSITFSSLKLFF